MANPISLLIKRPGFTSIMSEIRYNFNRYKSEIATSVKGQTPKNLPLAGFRVVDLTRILGEYYHKSHEISLLQFLI